MRKHLLFVEYLTENQSVFANETSPLTMDLSNPRVSLNARYIESSKKVLLKIWAFSGNGSNG